MIKVESPIHKKSGGTEYLLPKDDSRRYSYGEIDGVGTVDNIQYDRNGNIQSLQRTARAAGQTVIFDQLAYYYKGNRLLAVDDAIKGQTTLGDFTDNGRRFDGISPEYHYDPNGNVITDENRGLKIGYTEGNNMPALIAHEGGTIMNRYSFGGQKLGRKFLDANGQLVSDETYYGSLVMEQRDPSRILFEDGYVDLTPGQRPAFNYHLKDHLGNVRIVLQPGGNMYGTVVQSNDYFPFGMAYTHSRALKYDGDALAFDERAATENITYTKDNRYLYNGKEEQPMPGRWLDYGARFYDAQLGRWHSVDPAAALYYPLSPYQYGGNSPVNTIDIGGKLFVYVNGFMYNHWRAGNQPERTFTSQGTIQNPLYSEYAPDRNFYTDGPRNAGKLFEKDYWHGIPNQFSEIFKDQNKIFTNGSFTPGSSGSERFGEGYKNASKLIKKLENGDVKLSDGETIKIIGHSQGAAYAAGLATALLEHPVYKHLVEFVVYLAPDQPNQFNHPVGVPGYQFSTQSDWVSSTGILAWLRNSEYQKIDGATWAQQRKSYFDSRGGHGVDSWVLRIIMWASSYGIPVTVYE